MVPQPVKAVILLFPITSSIEQKARQEDEKIAQEGQHPVDPTVFWVKQTVCSRVLLLSSFSIQIAFRAFMHEWSPIDAVINFVSNQFRLEMHAGP